MKFETVSADDLKRLQDELKFTSGQMADLIGVANGKHFRRYTSSAADPTNGRKMSFHMLFYVAVRLLSMRREKITLETVYAEMRRLGAKVNPLESSNSPEDA